MDMILHICMLHSSEASKKNGQIFSQHLPSNEGAEMAPFKLFGIKSTEVIVSEILFLQASFGIFFLSICLRDLLCL